MEKPLYIPKGKRGHKATVFCYHCHTNVSDICKETGKSLKHCLRGNKHAFKVYVPVPGTDNQRKTKTLKTRDINVAIRMAQEFENEVKGNTKPRETTLKIKKENNRQTKTTPHLLVHALSKYIGYLNNEGVPEHRIKERSPDHIKDVERASEEFVQCLKENGYDLSNFSVEDISDEVMGKVFTFYKEKQFAPRTYNKRLSHLTTFMNYYIKEYDSSLKNWFEGINRKPINANPESISKNEFEGLLKRVTSENGIKEYDSEAKPTRNMYRPWLADGFKLALLTGRRREEIVNLNFKDIITSDEGLLMVIKVEDFKVNRIQHQSDEAGKKFIYVPVTKELHKLLIEFGYEKYKGTNTYMLAPEIQGNRSRQMCDTLSRGFSHYFNQLETKKKLTFKSLRKTYITNLSIFMGGNAKSVTGHSDDAVVEKHYLDKQVIAKAAQGFEVFPKETERKSELKQLRNNSPIKQKKMEVEK